MVVGRVECRVKLDKNKTCDFRYYNLTYEIWWGMCSLRKENMCHILGEKGIENSEDWTAISEEGNQNTYN